MNQSRLKGYVLTFLGWLIAALLAAVIAYLSTYLFFRDIFFSATERFADIPLAAGLAGLVVGEFSIGFFVFTFQLIILIASIFFVKLTLKKLPNYRSATIAWLFALLFFSPFVLILAINMSAGWLIVVWLFLSPLFARLLATWNK